MTQTTDDNPFQSPTVLEQIPPPPSAPKASIDSHQLPHLVAVTWMLFLFAATVHGMAAWFFGSIEWGIFATLSVAIGFVVLYPSALLWGLGLGYAFLAATMCFCANAGAYIEPHPRFSRPGAANFFDLTPLVMYLGIMGLMIVTSRYYVFGPKHAAGYGAAGEEEG
ncbi:hypothetical protein [Blastopirellula marina]|uniref:Uncharacterized protein n=1 Tax=Blastopirellula marina TaxID=124 RepID=A0A2S8GP50_9BACT|nr:hypothetical protein [Blastopirellula marina]PQO46223.1 hypothetical protein C5Y93_09560 [Blastopirellula marina]